jgi:ATP-dependent RNA helicase DDX3X
MMFSATFPREARAVAKEYMAKDHIRIRVGRAGSSHINVTQKVCTSIQGS